MTYFNTTKETPEQVKFFSEKNDKQTKMVMQFVENTYKFSASKIFRLWPIDNTPITSIRRAFNTLETKKKIIKTGNKVIGFFGRPENEYIKVSDLNK